MKSEKNKLSSALKAAEKDIAKFKETQQTLLIENDDLKCKLNVVNDIMKSKDSEITDAAKEKTKLKHENQNLQREVTTVTSKYEKDLKNAHINFQCHLCDQNVEGHSQMRLHVREKHSCDCESQTESAVPTIENKIVKDEAKNPI